MRKFELILACCLLLSLGLGFAAWSNAQEKEAPARPRLEYRIVPAGELGIKNYPGGGAIFKYDEAADKLTQFAKDGWRYRDVITNGPMSAVLLERER